MSNTYQNKGHGNNQGYQDRNNQFKTVVDMLKDGYLQNGYYVDEEKEKRNKDYIIKFAKEIAKSLEDEGKGQKNNSSQIRKFYDYCLRVQAKLQSKNNDYSYIEADVARLRPTVAYAKGRGVVTKCLEDFINANIEKINDAKDYYAFMKHFEAVIAFMKK